MALIAPKASGTTEQLRGRLEGLRSAAGDDDYDAMVRRAYGGTPRDAPAGEAGTDDPPAAEVPAEAAPAEGAQRELSRSESTTSQASAPAADEEPPPSRSSSEETAANNQAFAIPTDGTFLQKFLVCRAHQHLTPHTSHLTHMRVHSASTFTRACEQHRGTVPSGRC